MLLLEVSTHLAVEAASGIMKQSVLMIIQRSERVRTLTQESHMLQAHLRHLRNFAIQPSALAS